MTVKQNKEITKDQAVFMTVNDWKFTFELWPNKYKYQTMNHLYMPEFILNVGWDPFVYFIDIFYVLGERMLELKALKLYLASYKDMRFDTFDQVFEKLKTDLQLLSESKYMKIEIYDRNYVMITGSTTYKDNFAFDSYLESTSELIKLEDEQVFSNIISYTDAIVNISHSVPVICDIYIITDSTVESVKWEFIKSIMQLTNEQIITEEVPKFVLDKIKHLCENVEVIVDFNIRGNIKKLRSVYQGDLSKLTGRDAYIQQITSQFSSYTN